jgi:hypothetical protein
MLITVLIAGCCALMRMDPLVGIPLSILAAPSLLRTVLVIASHPREAKKTSTLDKIISFSFSYAAMAAMLIPASFVFEGITHHAFQTGKGVGLYAFAGLLAAIGWVVIIYRVIVLPARSTGL